MKVIELFKLLSDENRLKIFVLLLKHEACICEIEEILHLKQANVSKHMMKFKELDMVDIRKDAQWIYYKISDTFIQANGHLINYIQEQVLKKDDMKDLMNHVREFHCK